MTKEKAPASPKDAALKQVIDLIQPVAALADGTPFEHSEVIQRCVDAVEIALKALAQPAPEKIRVINGIIHTLEWTPQVMQPAAEQEQKAEQEDSGYLDWLRHQEESALAKLKGENT